MSYSSKRFSLILFYLILYVQTILTTSTDFSLDTGSSDAITTVDPGTNGGFSDISTSRGVSASIDNGQTAQRTLGPVVTGGQANSVASSIGETGIHSTVVPQTAPSGNPATNVPGAHTNPTNGGNGNTGTGSFASVSLNTDDSATDKTNNPSPTPSQTGATGVTNVIPLTSTTSRNIIIIVRNAFVNMFKIISFF